MADDQDQSQKTEEPSQKRLEDAHKRGEVVKSQEVKHLFMILGGTLALSILATSGTAELQHVLAPFLSAPHLFDPNGFAILGTIKRLGSSLVAVLSLPLGVLMIAAAAGNMVQHKPVFTFEKIKPKLNKISVLQGFKKLFSLHSFVEFLKSIAKVTIVAVIMLILVWPEKDRLEGLVSYEPAALMGLITSLVFRLLFGVIVIMAFIAALDYGFQRAQSLKKQRMTKQEVREEHKQLEGDPHIKARLRQIRNERARKRMMAEVPDATVVIANPTHFAVALKYVQDEMDAPRVVAKGADDIALRIRGAAEDNDVPVIENPPLARALYDTVELDEIVPPEHYKAVAEVIGYVMSLNNKRRFSSTRARSE